MLFTWCLLGPQSFMRSQSWPFLGFWGGLKEGENSRFERNECEKQNQGPEKPLSGDFQENRKNPGGVSAF
jgi:hypothetical protein